MKKEIKYLFLMALFLVVVAIITGGFLYFKNKPNNNPDPTPGSADDNNQEDRNDYLIKTFTSFGTCSTGKEFSFNNNIVTLNDLSKDDINHITYNYLHLKGLNTTRNETTKMQHLKLERSAFLSAVKRLFGQNYTYELPETLRINNSEFTHTGDYYEGDIQFVTCFDELYPQFLHYQTMEEEKTYIIEYALYWQKTTFDDASQTMKETIYSSKDTKEEVCQKSEISNNIDKFTKYRFIFKDDGTNYIFDHIELVN